MALMQGTQSRYKAYCFITLLYLQQMLLKLLFGSKGFQFPWIYKSWQNWAIE
jgi:hypothetical protein